MRTQTAALFGALIVAAPILVLACKKDDATPQPTTPSTYPSGSAYGTYPQQPYPQQAMTAPPNATATAVPPGQMATPGPAALPCTNDSMCMTHKCNTQFGKCAFPCESDNDCITGAYCFKSAISACLPKGPGQ